MAGRTTLLACLLALAAPAPGCTDPELGRETWICETDDDCGSGWACQGGLCARQGAAPDIGRGPDVTSFRCGGEACPELAGHAVSCNAQAHCEYTPGAPIVSGARERLIWVPAGPFPMGSPDSEDGVSYCGGDCEQPQHEVSFAVGFFVGKHEVTAEAFAAFLTSRGGNNCSYEGGSDECLDAADSDRNVHWDGSSHRADPRWTCQAVPGGASEASCASHPVVAVTWYGAGAFCAEAGGRLCSESEWERAAEGSTHRLYPWGEGSPDETLANCRESVCGDGFDRTAPVGSFAAGASPVGALDMAGNVWEWVEDDWHGSYDEARRPDDGSAWTDSPRAAYRVVRGGSWGNGAAYLRAAVRAGYYPAGAYDILGFRCCRSAY